MLRKLAERFRQSNEELAICCPCMARLGCSRAGIGGNSEPENQSGIWAFPGRHTYSISDAAVGTLIAELAEMGFSNVLGADPYIAEDIVRPSGARILKCEADKIEGQFDVVMMHHSLEHIWDQKRLPLTSPAW